MPSSHLILFRPLLFLPPITSSITIFSNESTLCMRWPKYWSFSFSISPSNEHPGLIFLRMDWLDLLTVQWTLKSLLQHHSSRASIVLSLLFTYYHSYKDRTMLHLNYFHFFWRKSFSQVTQWWTTCLQCRKHGFDSWVGKIPWRRKWQPTSVFLPEKSQWQRSLAGYNPWVGKESDMA